VTGGAHDTLRDELAAALVMPMLEAPEVLPSILADAVLPVVLRYADAQVAAARERIYAYEVNIGTEATPDWVTYNPADVEVVYLETDP
jgi:hypothetical protein